MIVYTIDAREKNVYDYCLVFFVSTFKILMASEVENFLAKALLQAVQSGEFK